MAIDDEQPTVTEPMGLLTPEQRLEHIEQVVTLNNSMLHEVLDLLRGQAGSGRLGHD